MSRRHSLSFLQSTFDRTLQFSAGAIRRAQEIRSLLSSQTDNLDGCTRAELATELHDQLRILRKFDVKVKARGARRSIESPNPGERLN